jgi:hypothetical protein
MLSARKARVISLVETRLDRITTLTSAPSQRTFYRFIPTQLKNESSPANQPKTADRKSDGLLARLHWNNDFVRSANRGYKPTEP